MLTAVVIDQIDPIEWANYPILKVPYYLRVIGVSNDCLTIGPLRPDSRCKLDNVPC